MINIGRHYMDQYLTMCFCSYRTKELLASRVQLTMPGFAF